MIEVALYNNDEIPLGCPAQEEEESDKEHYPKFCMEEGNEGEDVHFYVDCSCHHISSTSMIYEVEEPEQEGTTASSIHNNKDGLREFIFSIGPKLGYTEHTVPHITVNGVPVYKEFPEIVFYEG